MPSTYPRVLRILTVLVVASVVWMLLESVRLTQSHQIVAPGTARETLVLLPSRSVMALYVFLIVVTLIPPTSIAALVWLPGGKTRFRPSDTMKTPARVLYCTLVLLGIAVSASITGFAYEALQTELSLTRDRLAYRAGS